MIFWLFQWGWHTHCDILHGADVKTQEVHAQSGWFVLFSTSGKFWFLPGIPSILASMFFFIFQFLKKEIKIFPCNWNIIYSLICASITNLVWILQDSKLVPFLSAGLSSPDRTVVQTALQLFTFGTTLEAFPTVLWDFKMLIKRKIRTL